MSLPKNIDKTPKVRVDFGQGEFFADPPEPYRPIESDQIPPSYLAYNRPLDTDHPKFPEDAIEFALRASAPPQSTIAADLDKYIREEVEMVQGQYIRSIKYGDQRNRGLDELTRFQEDLIHQVAEASGLTTEQIERRRKLSSWDGEREKFNVD